MLLPIVWPTHENGVGTQSANTGCLNENADAFADVATYGRQGKAFDFLFLKHHLEILRDNDGAIQTSAAAPNNATKERDIYFRKSYSTLFFSNSNCKTNYAAVANMDRHIALFSGCFDSWTQI